MSAYELVSETDHGTVVEPVSHVKSQPVRADEAEKKYRIAKALWAFGGFICFVLGVLGAILPIIPTTPFLLAAAFFFARSSKKLDLWFKSTKLYTTVLEGYTKKRTMTLKAKLMMLFPITVLLGISFILMADVPIGRAVVVFVWIGHLVYFGFIVKTERT